MYMSKRFVTYRTEDAKAGLVNVDENGVMKTGGAGVTSWNNLTDKPFGETIEPTTIQHSDSMIGGLIPGAMSGYGDSAGYLIPRAIIAGETYRVTVDGVEYEGVATEVYFPDNDYTGITLFYRSIDDWDTIPVPVSIFSYETAPAMNVSHMYCNFKNDFTQKHSLTIQHVKKNVTAIDPKYITGSELTEADEGKFVRVIDGKLQAVAVPNAEEASF